MSICRRCNRPLKREPFKSQGIGKICAGKEAAANKSAEAETGDIIVPYDGGDIWIERIGQKTTPDGGVNFCSGIRTNVQRTITRHSPTGFNFGYGGSGPAELALNILMMFTDEATANANYQGFKWAFIAVDAGERLVISKNNILIYLASLKEPVSD